MEDLDIIKYLNSAVTKKFPCVHYVSNVNLKYAPYTFSKDVFITISSKLRLHKTYEYELKTYISTLLEFTADLRWSDSNIHIGYIKD